jgi:hypothetical protein
MVRWTRKVSAAHFSPAYNNSKSHTAAALVTHVKYQEERKEIFSEGIDCWRIVIIINERKFNACNSLRLYCHAELTKLSVHFCRLLFKKCGFLEDRIFIK